MNTKTETQQMMTVLPDIDEAFRQRVNAVFDQWVSNHLDFELALIQLSALRQEALSSSNPINEGCVDNILGVMYAQRSNFEQSNHHFMKALAVFESYQALRRLASCSLNIGENYRILGNYARSQQNFQRTYQIAKQLNDLELQAIALTNEGLMLLGFENKQAAKTILEKALALIENDWHPQDKRQQINRIDNLCEIHYALAKLHLQQKALVKAWEAALLSLQYAQENARPFRIGHAYRALATVISKLRFAPDSSMSSDPDFYFQASLDAFKLVNAESEIAKTLFAQGQSYAERGRKEAANQNFQQALQVFNKLAMWQDAAQVSEAQLTLL